MISRIIIVLFAVCLFPLSANAQYVQSNVIDDVLYFVVKNEVTESIRIKDAQILASNKVREVLISNDSKKPIGKLLINNFGYTEDFYTYNDTSGMIEVHWRFGYDVNNNMTSASLRKGRQRINYILSYENNQLASIHKDSAGVEGRYDFTYTDGIIYKITVLNFTVDTSTTNYYLNYDDKKRPVSIFIKIGDGSRNEILSEIIYQNSTVHIHNLSLPDIAYDFQNERISNYTTTIVYDNPASAIVRKEKTEYEYFYSDNGLIKSIEVKFPNGKQIYTEHYEYTFR
ncbi:MAG: hypothetical protein J0M18_21270 [Ignavibacteria bacterium]|nr:hypothetical protein [Ignavibacteria bacterium]